MSKHTPGPWRAHNKAAYGWSITTGTIACQHIATVQQYVGLSHDAAAANVRLIAAAPDLLDALRPFAGLPGDTPPPGILPSVWRQAIEAAQDAISKAERAP